MVDAAALAEDSPERDLPMLETRERHRLRVWAQCGLDVHRRPRSVPGHVLVDSLLHVRQAQRRSANFAGFARKSEISRGGRCRRGAIADALQVSLLHESVTSRHAASDDQEREQEAAKNQRNRRASVVGQPSEHIHGVTTR